jgi:endonuclease/exonuclease/phosphatase family metal-dependent hydrolase
LPTREALVSLVPDSSPFLGFFDLAGVEPDDWREVEVPDFRGTPDFADVGFWNIEHFNAEVGDDRVETVADVLDRLSMDVIGLVEVEGPALERLVGALRRRGNASGFELLDVAGRQDLAVLYDRETAEVELADDIAERHRDALAARTPAGRRAFPRQPLFARVQVADGNRRPVAFVMVVVHFKAFGDAQSRARRRLAAQSLAGIIEDVRERDGLPVVLGGDFNEDLNTDVLSALRDSPDLFALTLDDASQGAASYVGGQHRSLIDHIIVSRDVRAGSIVGDDAAIVRLDRSVRNFADKVSDHTPVVMRLVARGEPLPVTVEPGPPEGASVVVPSGARELKLTFS